MTQLLLWDDTPPFPRPNPSILPTPHFPCPGCGAKAGAWTRADRGDEWVHHLIDYLPTDPDLEAYLGEQFEYRPGDLDPEDISDVAHFLPLCDECADCEEVVLELLYLNPPDAAEPSPYSGADDAKTDILQERAALGYHVFHPADKPGCVWKPKPIGPPDTQHAPGETGVERCGERWRVRPFYRGRKWHWGIYDTEEGAISAAREFRKLYAHDQRPKPPLWLPCEGRDGEFGAIAIEYEHFDHWRTVYPGAPAKKIARTFRTELKRLRTKPTALEVFSELESRLEQASGPALFRGFDWCSGQAATEGETSHEPSSPVESDRRVGSNHRHDLRHAV